VAKQHSPWTKDDFG